MVQSGIDHSLVSHIQVPVQCTYGTRLLLSGWLLSKQKCLPTSDIQAPLSLQVLGHDALIQEQTAQFVQGELTGKRLAEPLKHGGD